MDFARPNSANRKFLNLNDVIERVLSIVANQLSFNHVVVHKELNDSLAEVSIDDGQLQQVFINLFVNASDAMGEKGGKLTLSSSSVRSDGKEYVQIKVTDTGCGIAKENLSKIFEPFYSTKDQKGTGLGLSVVWGIIDKHLGTISVESEIGKGSTFTILIPVGQRSAILKKGQIK